jgi:hypothetical protein
VSGGFYTFIPVLWWSLSIREGDKFQPTDLARSSRANTYKLHPYITVYMTGKTNLMLLLKKAECSRTGKKDSPAAASNTLESKVGMVCDETPKKPEKHVRFADQVIYIGESSNSPSSICQPARGSFRIGGFSIPLLVKKVL